MEQGHGDSQNCGKLWGVSELTVFFGDDVSDEDGFAVVQEGEGMAVMVGPPGQPTQAMYRVDSSQEVVETLKLLAQL